MDNDTPGNPGQTEAEGRAEQSLGTAVIAGAVAAACGAAAWAAITVATGYQIGFMAIGIGFLVGLAVRRFGRGVDTLYGAAGSALALAGCVAGNLLAGCAMVASEAQVGLWDVVSRLTPSLAVELLTAMFTPMDVLFYGLAAYEGYRLSFRRFTRADVAARVSGMPPVAG